LRSLIHAHSLTFARTAALVLPYHFPKAGSVMKHRSTCELLQYSSVVCEGMMMPLDLPDRGQRVAYYAKAHYSHITYDTYTRFAKRWEIYAGAGEVDPQAPSPRDIAQFVEVEARRYSDSTVVMFVQALRYYFECAGVEDITRHVIVQDALRAVAQNKKERRGMFLVSDVRRMLGQLDDDPCDVRDRCIVLAAFLGGVNGTDMGRLSTDVCTITDDDVAIQLSPRHLVRISRVDDQTFDFGYWLQRWLSYIPAGPLFPYLTRRGAWSKRAMCYAAFHHVLRRVAGRAGFSQWAVLVSLKRGFIYESVPRHGAVMVAHHLRMSVAAIEHHYPPARGRNGAYRRRYRTIEVR
jgi:hypothetical protein